MRKFIVMILLVGMLISVTGCATVKGLARDIANTGNNIKDVVEGLPSWK